MIRQILIGFLFIWLHGFVYGQACDIHFSGRVLDQGSKEPLEYSTIAIEETNDYILTDSIGQFSHRDMCPGAYHIQVFHIGCPPKQFYLRITRDTQMIFYLDHHGELLKEVVVEGAHDSFQKSRTQKSITSSAIRNQAGASLADMTENVAGVRTLKNGSGITKPIIHGLYGNRVSVINNGLLQAGQQWGADHAPEIDPNAANTITVVKGSEAIEYGSSALGGAILVDVGPIKEDPHLHGFMSYVYGTNGRSHTLTGMANRSSGKFGWRVSGTIKKAGDQHTPDYFLTNTGYNELNGSLQLVFHPSQKTEHEVYYSLFNTRLGIFAGAFSSNLTELEEALGRDIPFNINDDFSYDINPPSQKVQHHLLKYSGRRFINPETYYEWVVGSQYDYRREYDRRRGGRADIPALDLRLFTQTLQLKYVRDSERIRYKLGGQFSYANNTNDPETGVLPLIPDYERGILGAYGLAHYALGKFELEGGARYDFQTLVAWPITLTVPREVVKTNHIYHNYAITIGGVYQPNKDVVSRLQFALANRSPEPNELYSIGLHQGVASIEEGNWDIQPEISFKTIFTQSFHWEEWFHFDVSLYSHLFDRYIYLQPQDELRLTIRGAYPVYIYEQEDAWIRGVDFVVVSDFSHHLEWNAKFSWLRGTSLPDNQSLSLMPAAEVSSAISWAIKDTPLFKGSRLSIEGSYTAMQHHWDEEAELVPPPDDYFLLGLSANTGLSLNGHILNLGISVSNLLNIRYRDYLNRLRYFSDEQGINIRMSCRYIL